MFRLALRHQTPCWSRRSRNTQPTEPTPKPKPPKRLAPKETIFGAEEPTSAIVKGGPRCPPSPMGLIFYPGLGIASAVGCRFRGWVLVRRFDWPSMQDSQLGPSKQKHPTPGPNTRPTKNRTTSTRSLPYLVRETQLAKYPKGGPNGPPIPRMTFFRFIKFSFSISMCLAGGLAE